MILAAEALLRWFYLKCPGGYLFADAGDGNNFSTGGRKGARDPSISDCVPGEVEISHHVFFCFHGLLFFGVIPPDRVRREDGVLKR